ncbi:MAG: hypothetical protein NXI09_15440 [Bacteroidetes bacterium]|nr:hypothetical protein [Bacteroidota bacterium]
MDYKFEFGTELFQKTGSSKTNTQYPSGLCEKLNFNPNPNS